MVKQGFAPDDAKAVLSIPLNSRFLADRLIWACTPKGNFTVRSAYRVALLSSSNLSPETSSCCNRGLFWKTLWGQNMPNKIKTFAWLASGNILLTKAHLCHWKVFANPVFEACSLEAESIRHILWRCKIAREVWNLSGLLIETQGVHWHLIFVRQMGNDILELVIATSWHVVQQKCCSTRETRQSAAMVLQKARMLLVEFQVANAQPSKAVMSDTAWWTNPTSPWYKVNVDGAVFEQEASGVAIVIRDH